MPTYEYRCTKCKKKFELLQRITEKPAKKCVYCGAKPERLISAGVGLIFKGSGFYITDYKKSGPSKSEPKKDKPEQKTPAAPKNDKKSTDYKKSVVQ